MSPQGQEGIWEMLIFCIFFFQEKKKKEKTPANQTEIGWFTSVLAADF